MSHAAAETLPDVAEVAAVAGLVTAVIAAAVLVCVFAACRAAWRALRPRTTPLQ